MYAPDGEDPNQERPGGRPPPFPPRAGFLKKRWELKDKRGVQCYNCQKYGHIVKECFQRKKPCTPQPGPSTQARKTHQGEESDDEAKEQANVILRQMGEASDSVKKQPSQDVLHGDTAEEELGLARLVSSYTLPHQNSPPGERGQQTARSKVLSRRTRDT